MRFGFTLCPVRSAMLDGMRNFSNLSWEAAICSVRIDGHHVNKINVCGQCLHTLILLTSLAANTCVAKGSDFCAAGERLNLLLSATRTSATITHRPNGTTEIFDLPLSACRAYKDLIFTAESSRSTHHQANGVNLGVINCNVC